MAIIKKISVFNGSSWSDDNIGADASNISLNSSVTLNQVLLDKLTGGKVLVTNGSGIINASEIGTDKLGYLSGVTGPIQTQLDGKVSNTGDTITGSLAVKRPGSQIVKFDAINQDFVLGSTVSEVRYGHELYMGDANNSNMAIIRTVVDTDGTNRLQLVSYNRATTSSTSSSGQNALSLITNRDGTISVSVSGAAAWRNALGINNTVTVKSATSVSVASTTYTNIANTGSISAGTYIIRGYINYPSNATGRRVAIFSTTSGGSSSYNSMVNTKTAVNGVATYIHLVGLFTITSATTLYLVAYQNSGSTMTCSGRIELLKIH